MEKIDGELVTKGQLQQFAENSGLIVHQQVTKKLSLLVAADVNSQSGKAKKARKFGIPIIAENEFWSLIRKPPP
jgi:DNA polymerase-3 subunit epsilon